MGRFAVLQGEFDKRGVKLIGLSCDDVETHKQWLEDVCSFAKTEVKYPIIADEKRELAVKLGMIDPDEKDAAGMPYTCRAVFVIGQDKKLKLSFLYPATTGRNFEWVLFDLFFYCCIIMNFFPAVKSWELLILCSWHRSTRLLLLLIGR